MRHSSRVPRLDVSVYAFFSVARFPLARLGTILHFDVTGRFGGAHPLMSFHGGTVLFSCFIVDRGVYLTRKKNDQGPGACFYNLDRHYLLVMRVSW